MDLVVGCPAYHRDWILPAWFRHVDEACDRAGVSELSFLIVASRDDSPTLDLVQQQLTTRNGLMATFDEEEAHGQLVQGRERDWDYKRFHHMVQIRNRLLRLVRRHQPDHFLSVDSDVLLHPDALRGMLEVLGDTDAAAVGSKCYLSPTGRQRPNYANMVGSDGLWRADSDAIIPVEVLMAIKLMTPAAYEVDYQWHPKGEDIGWSMACGRRRLRFRWDGRQTSKHVMSREALDQIDARCGY